MATTDDNDNTDYYYRYYPASLNAGTAPQHINNETTTNIRISNS